MGNTVVRGSGKFSKNCSNCRGYIMSNVGGKCRFLLASFNALSTKKLWGKSGL
jgi:hypothetical protein